MWGQKYSTARSGMQEGGEAPTTGPAAAAVFKKPARRNNIRKRERDTDAGGGDGGDGGDGDDVGDSGGAVTGSSLELMRELQRQRQRARGVTLEPKAALDDVDEALATGGRADAPDAAAALDSTFTSQTDSGAVDPNMLKYIEEQMQGGGGGGGGGSAGEGGGRAALLDPEEAELYTTPAHLVGVVPGGAAAEVEEESANRWLAGILEVPLGTEEKMATVEATERATREMIARMADRKAARQAEEERDGYKMTVPTNFNSNFHSHRREFAIKRKAAMDKRDGGPSGGRGGGIASDAAAYGRFRQYERSRVRK